jgi:hypothetical protein
VNPSHSAQSHDAFGRGDIPTVLAAMSPSNRPRMSQSVSPLRNGCRYLCAQCGHGIEPCYSWVEENLDIRITVPMAEDFYRRVMMRS